MKRTGQRMKCMTIAAIVSLMPGVASQAAAKPLKVYILAGQSNMQDPAKTNTFDYIGDDPKTAPTLKEMVGPDGKPTVCEHAWLQGWNDLVAHDVYPKDEYSKYSEWLAEFIRDVRKDLNTPNMPFVIGVIGVDGI